MSGDITSLVTVIQNVSMISYTISWSGASPVGSMIVEVSNDYSQDVSGAVSNPGSWAAIPLGGSASVSGSPDSGFIDIDASAGYAVRLRYARTSGTGLMQATVVGKVS